ncbi:MAG: trypsin-like peptidase domain-containing protein [Gemmatimonadetes bacterium]|nr:trypsin-like peptidase domain-containing protein [Gemmatimonadota bacterium]
MKLAAKRYAQLTAVVGLALAPAFFALRGELPRSLGGSPAPATISAPAAEAKAPPSNSLAAWSDAFATVAQTVRPSVVFIRADTKPATMTTRMPQPFEFGDPRQPSIQRSSGTGFISSPDGYIITNNHVVDGADRLQVRLFDNRTYSATVVGRDPGTDVAVIKIDAKNLPAVTFGNSDSARVGEWVLAIGNPMGEELSFTVTAGIISAKGRPLSGLNTGSRYGIQDFIQTDAAINPGNSGGPLVNAEGRVIGINSAIASQTGSYEGYGFAIPSNLARRVVDELIAHGKVSRAILGLSIRPIDSDDAAYAGLDAVKGVVVQDFSGDDSPARRAGVRPGDVIVAIDGRPVEYVAQFQQAVAFRKPGEEVSLSVVRKGGEQTSIKVRLAAAPSDGSDVAKSRPHGRASSELYGSKLGITVEPATGEQSEQSGLAVTSVDPEGPAAEKLVPDGGPQGPDIITYVNDTRVKTVDQLNDVLKGTRSGEVVSLRVYNERFGGTGGSRVVRMRVQ